MQKILSIAWNDIKIEFSYRSTLVFFLILPLVFTLVIGAGYQGMEGDGDGDGDSRYRVVVVDQDQSIMSERLISAMEASDVIRPAVRTAEQAAEHFAEGDVLAVLTIPAGFESDLLGGEDAGLRLLKESGNNRTLAIEQGLDAVVFRVGSAVSTGRAAVEQAERISPFQSEEERQVYFDEALSNSLAILENPSAVAETTRASTTNVQVATGFEQSSPGQLVTWTLITLLGAAEVFVDERLAGTLRRLLVSPTRKTVIFLGKVTGRLGMGVAQMAILIGFGAVVLGVDWGNSWSALIVIVLSFALAAVALGVLLGALIRTRAQASGLVIMFSMLLAALGGAWWPLEVTPTAYQNVVKVLPTTWAMMGFNDVIVRGQGLQAVLPEAGVLLLFALIFFAVGVWQLRYE